MQQRLDSGQASGKNAAVQGKENVQEKGDNCRLQSGCELKDNAEISETEIETASTRSSASRACAGLTENAAPRTDPRDMGCDVTGLAVALAARVASLEEELASKDRQLTELMSARLQEPPPIPSPSRAWAWSRIGPLVDSPDSSPKGERSPIPACDPKPPGSASTAAQRPSSPVPKRQPLQARRAASPRLSSLAAPTAKAAAAPRGSSPQRRPLPAPRKQSVSPRRSDAGVKRVAARSSSPVRSAPQPSGSPAEVGLQAPSSPQRPSPRRLCSGFSPRWPIEGKIAAGAQADLAACSTNSPALNKECVGVGQCGLASATARKTTLARVVHRSSPVKYPVSSRPTPVGKRTTTMPNKKRASSPSPPVMVTDSATRGKALEGQATLQRDYSQTWLSIKESHLKCKAVDMGRDGAVSSGGAANTSCDDFLSIERLVNDGAITLDAENPI